MTGKVTETSIREALAAVVDPGTGETIAENGMIASATLQDGNCTVVLAVDPARGAVLEEIRQAAERAIRALEGLESVTVVMTAESKGAGPASSVPQAPHASAKKKPAGRESLKPPGVKHMIAIASGKGGVGKSTLAANLAVALAAQGVKTGLLDADIYGPSQARMLGGEGAAARENDEGKIEVASTADGMIAPMERHGVRLMSMGYLVPEDKPMIWRGPMVQGALMQLLRDVDWGALDIMLIDLPPGTGDAQLTLAQRVPLSGAIIISTPQDIALIDAKKGLKMFEQINVPILGMVENMSYHICSECGHRDEIFGHGGAEAEAEALGVPFLGAIPLHASIRSQGDSGTPIAASAPESAEGQAFKKLAETLSRSFLEA